jgi:hypothetical protein
VRRRAPLETLLAELDAMWGRPSDRRGEALAFLASIRLDRWPSLASDVLRRYGASVLATIRGEQPHWEYRVGDPSAVRTDWDPNTSRAIWFDRNAFRQPAPGTFATTHERNSLRQPGFWDVNLSLRKSFPVTGTGQRLDFRLEAFNVFNRTRLDNAVINPTLPDFGSIVARTGNRVMQVGMQYQF